MNSVEYLQSMLNELEKSLQKSHQFYKNGDINEDKNRLYRLNLIPKIRDFRKAIIILKQNNL